MVGGGFTRTIYIYNRHCKESPMKPKAIYGTDNEPAYWDATLETQSRGDWERLKLGLLKRHLQHAYAGSPYYRSSFTAAGVHPDQLNSLEDLRRFPFINKHTLRERQLAVPPFGDLVAVPERDIVYISASSGSTGVPTASPFTQEDFDAWIDYEARQFWSSGMRPTDRYCHSLNFSLFIGGPCVLGAQKVGALSMHAGTVPSERLLQILRQFQANILWTTPSYAWYLGETAIKEGIDLQRDLAVRRSATWDGDPTTTGPRPPSPTNSAMSRIFQRRFGSPVVNDSSADWFAFVFAERSSSSRSKIPRLTPVQPDISANAPS